MSHIHGSLHYSIDHAGVALVCANVGNLYWQLLFLCITAAVNYLRTQHGETHY